MLYIGAIEVPGSDDHEGYVAGRSRNGVYSDIWTDVRRCPEGTFVAYAPVCECGWRGPDQPVTDAGYRSCQQSWINGHFAQLPAAGGHPAPEFQQGVPARDILQG